MYAEYSIDGQVKAVCSIPVLLVFISFSLLY